MLEYFPSYSLFIISLITYEYFGSTLVVLIVHMLLISIHPQMNLQTVEKTPTDKHAIFSIFESTSTSISGGTFQVLP